jgi:hypothetical protein
MELLLGGALVAVCVASMWLARARDGETVPLLRSDFAQQSFVIAWICALTVGIAVVVRVFTN